MIQNRVYKRLLEIINKEKNSFNILVNADNNMNFNLNIDEIINYIEFNMNNKFNNPIIGNILITEGEILVILDIINNLINYEGDYIIYINEDNLGTITYLINRTNKIYKEYNIPINIKLDYSRNYNKYLNELVTIIGSEDFVNVAYKDFSNANKIIL